MSRSSGLGRGLSALLPAAAPGQSGLIRVGLDAVRPNPRQPRGSFDPEALAELAQSLRQVGMLQPIVVRPVEQGRYEIVAGERRFRAAQLAGMDEVPAIVRHTEDDALLTEALIENIHRADLDPLEEASAYQQLLEDFGITHEDLAVRLGRSRPAISNSLRLLTLPQSVQDLLATGALTAGHARALLSLRDAGQQQRTAQRVAGEGLSVRATEELVRRLLAAEDEKPEQTIEDLATAAKARQRQPYGEAQRRLEDALGTRVTISGTARRGRIVIDYAGARGPAAAPAAHGRRRGRRGLTRRSGGADHHSPAGLVALAGRGHAAGGRRQVVHHLALVGVHRLQPHRVTRLPDLGDRVTALVAQLVQLARPVALDVDRARVNAAASTAAPRAARPPAARPACAPRRPISRPLPTSCTVTMAWSSVTSISMSPGRSSRSSRPSMKSAAMSAS